MKVYVIELTDDEYSDGMFTWTDSVFSTKKKAELSLLMSGFSIKETLPDTTVYKSESWDGSMAVAEIREMVVDDDPREYVH